MSPKARLFYIAKRLLVLFSRAPRCVRCRPRAFTLNKSCKRGQACASLHRMTCHDIFRKIKLLNYRIRQVMCWWVSIYKAWKNKAQWVVGIFYWMRDWLHKCIDCAYFTPTAIKCVNGSKRTRISLICILFHPSSVFYTQSVLLGLVNVLRHWRCILLLKEHDLCIVKQPPIVTVTIRSTPCIL